ncbi:hypothetical protein B0J14DRAFT_558302 [Halenospora varia]|nr:hypothetical protein B0J14DRAFT_558302 [Halenospora varia]
MSGNTHSSSSKPTGKIRDQFNNTIFLSPTSQSSRITVPPHHTSGGRSPTTNNKPKVPPMNTRELSTTSTTGDLWSEADGGEQNTGISVFQVSTSSLSGFLRRERAAIFVWMRTWISLILFISDLNTGAMGLRRRGVRRVGRSAGEDGTEEFSVR